MSHNTRTPGRMLAVVVACALVLSALLVAMPAAEAGSAGGGIHIPLTYGWYQGRSTYYYSFSNPIPSPDGGATITPAPIFVFFYGNDTPVPGQHNIVDVVPGNNGYSDLWQVHKVTVPDNYTPDSVRSYQGIVNNAYPVTPTTLFVNCPIVPSGSDLQYSQQGLTQGWYHDTAVFYFDFGLNPTASAPIYVLFYGNGNPVPDQRNIIDVKPGDSGYSTFWRVHKVTVPDNYVANSARSLSDLQNAGYTITPTSILVNCPVVRTEDAPQMFDLTGGWYRNGTVTYYSFANPVPSPDGGTTVTPAPIFVLFFANGNPVPGQHNIIDVVPGSEGYSDLWQVQKVTVPDNYVADSVRSYAQIVAGGYPITPMNLFVNCPVVPEGSMLGTLEQNLQSLTQGWYRGQNVFYFDFGLNSTSSAPIYVFFYANGNPVSGQNNIIDTIPGMPDYSAFWQVHKVTVPDNYVANSVRSFSGIMNAGYPVAVTAILVNCPVHMSPTAVTVSDMQAGATASSLPAVGAGLALLLVAGALLARRRRVQIL